jgi:hypothetical protein
VDVDGTDGFDFHDRLCRPSSRTIANPVAMRDTA